MQQRAVVEPLLAHQVILADTETDLYEQEGTDHWGYRARRILPG